jgi:hypothetical protein
MSDVPNISIGSITGGQNNIGKTEIAGDQVQTNNYGNQPPPLDLVLDAVAEAIPAEVRGELVEQVIEPIREKLVAVELLETEQEQEAAKPTLVDRVTGLASKLQPYAPAITKALLAFGETSLMAIQPPAGWVASALLSAVRAMNKPESGATNNG